VIYEWWKKFWFFYLLSLHAIRKRKRLQNQWSNSRGCLMVISRDMFLQSLCSDFLWTRRFPNNPEKISNFWYFQIECHSRDRDRTRMLIQLACFSCGYFSGYGSWKILSKFSPSDKGSKFFVLLSYINLVPFNRDGVGVGPK